MAQQASESYWDAVEPIWGRVSIYDGPETFLKQFGAVSAPRGHLLAAHWCQSEVRNGGLHQFFTNPTGVLAPEAAAGFRAIGLEACAQLVEQAMGFFGVPYPREQLKRIECLEAIQGDESEEWDPFDELNDRFFALLDEPEGGFEGAADRYWNQGAQRPAFTPTP